MGKHLAAVGVVLLLLGSGAAQTADSTLAQRFSGVLHYAQLRNGTQDFQGAGGKLSFDLNKNFALEAVVNLFPENTSYLASPGIPLEGPTQGGHAIQGLFGLKARLVGTDRFTLSAKIRPGFISFGNVVAPVAVQVPTACPAFDIGVCTQITASNVSAGRQTGFSFDYGGVLDVTTSKHTFLCLEFGGTTIQYPKPNFQLPANTAQNIISISTTTVRSTNNLQLSTGFGFRF